MKDDFPLLLGQIRTVMGPRFTTPESLIERKFVIRAVLMIITASHYWKSERAVWSTKTNG
jgi:hypothetical protein